MTRNRSRILFIGDRSRWSAQASRFLEQSFEQVQSVFWERGMSSAELDTWEGDWILSFKSDLLLDDAILSVPAKGAVNFHPAPPRYRGIGGYHYATANGEQQFGATCHHMDSRIDHGAIIETVAFGIVPGETAVDLMERTAAYCLVLFYETVGKIARGETLPCSQARWGEVLYTRKELERYLAQQSERALGGTA